MLIRFTASNYLSFNEEIEFSMIPGKSRNHRHHVVKGNKRSSIGALKTAVIYGANASGKSNLIKAISFARKVIVKGIRPKISIPRTHFKFDTACADKPSRFEFEFKQKEKAYAYGFELDTRKIHNEWLYEITKTTQKKIFQRKTMENDETAVEFGKVNFEDQNEQKMLRLMKTRKNQLFLTQSIEAGTKQFEHILTWFRKLIIIFPDSHAPGLKFVIEKDDVIRHGMVDLLKFFDTGISSINLAAIDTKKEFSFLPDEINSLLTENLESGKQAILNAPGNTRYIASMTEKNKLQLFKMMTGHKTKKNGQEVLMEINALSDGTQRLIDLIPPLLAVLKDDRVCFIDEFDRSMHPKLSVTIMELFLNSKANRESQLIVTTHDSSLLNLGLLRRDEIWFVEKNNEGASTVYSLEEFVPRYDRDVRKGYLLGRFGAIPVENDVSQLEYVLDDTA